MVYRSVQFKISKSGKNRLSTARFILHRRVFLIFNYCIFMRHVTLLLKLISLAVLFLTAYYFGIFGFATTGEGYFIFDPNIDTRYTEKFNEIKFNTIGPDSDTSDVIRLIGKPMRISLLDDSTYLWHYTTDGKLKKGDFAWLGREVNINRDGRVIKIIKNIYYD